ncbi:MAG: hypothetical protein K1X64_13785 [Myxococcaceae bacterium]|nr:hypothetical protein [Myxococcaceae bacterium]
MSIFDSPNLFSFKTQYDKLAGTPNLERFGKKDLATFGRDLSKSEQQEALKWLAERGVTDIQFPKPYRRGPFDPAGGNTMNVLAWPFRNIGTQIEALMSDQFWRPTSVRQMRAEAIEARNEANFRQHGGPYTLDARDFNQFGDFVDGPEALERNIKTIDRLNEAKFNDWPKD